MFLELFMFWITFLGLVFTSLAAPPPAVPDPPCDTEKGYLLCHVVRTFENARQYCADRSAELPVIESMQENKELSAHARAAYGACSGPLQDCGVWLGLKKDVHSRTYGWVHGTSDFVTSPVEFSNWWFNASRVSRLMTSPNPEKVRYGNRAYLNYNTSQWFEVLYDPEATKSVACQLLPETTPTTEDHVTPKIPTTSTPNESTRAPTGTADTKGAGDKDGLPIIVTIVLTVIGTLLVVLLVYLAWRFWRWCKTQDPLKEAESLEFVRIPIQEEGHEG